MVDIRGRNAFCQYLLEGMNTSLQNNRRCAANEIASDRIYRLSISSSSQKMPNEQRCSSIAPAKIFTEDKSQAANPQYSIVPIKIKYCTIVLSSTGSMHLLHLFITHGFCILLACLHNITRLSIPSHMSANIAKAWIVRIYVWAYSISIKS